MKAKQYAEALYEATIGKDDADGDLLVSNLLTLLESRGHSVLLPAIMRELQKLTRERQSAQVSVIRVCRSADQEKFKDAISKDIQTLGASALPQHRIIDKTIVGGYEVKAFGKQIDRTYKRSLLSLYTNLITNS